MGVKERKERERRQRHNEILEAARACFEAKGFLKTTLQDVANEAEVSVGLIYRYFQSKEDIFASLALKGAVQFDKDLKELLGKAESGNAEPSPAVLLKDITTLFFAFYSPYGEYFDLLLYSYKGLKEVQIRGTTLTRLMSTTLCTLDRLKDHILQSPNFRAQNEDEALRTVFMLWGTLLGTHKLVDSSGRGHLFAFMEADFLDHVIGELLYGIANGPPAPALMEKSSPEVPAPC